MKISHVVLSSTVHHERLLCSWRNCIEDDGKPRIAEHHANFMIHTLDGKVVERLMGLCDIHRGAFKRQLARLRVKPL